MPNSYYHLLGHIVVATHACHESAELADALKKSGFGRDKLSSGEKLASDAEALVERKLDTIGEDRIHEHSLHASASELEMWLQTVHFAVKKAVDEESVVEKVKAKGIHADEHAVTAVAQALRAMSMLRCDDRIHEQMGGARPIRQLVNRGLSLTKKLYKAAEIRLAPEAGDRSEPIFDELENTRQAMQDWMRGLDAAALLVAEKNPRLIGRLGYVPDGVGIPAGGSSRAVVLHERGQTAPPDPNTVGECSGWSVGRQGRNRENLGKGWVTPEA